MLTIPLPNQKPKLDRVDRFPTLADFNNALVDAMARRDEGAVNDLLQNFRCSDYAAHRIARDG